MAAAAMKSTAAACAVLLAIHPVQADRALFRRSGLFHRPGWGGRSGASTTANGPRRTNTALVLFPRGGDVAADSAVAEEASAAQEDQSLDDRVEAAMRRLGLIGGDGDGDSPRPTSISGGGDGDDDAIPPPPTPLAAADDDGGANCEGGVCALEPQAEVVAVADGGAAATAEDTEETDAAPTTDEGASVAEVAAVAEDDGAVAAVDAAEEEMAPAPTTEEDIYQLAESICSEMSVPRDIAYAAIYSTFSGPENDRRINEELARSMVRAEVDMIAGVSEDCPEVKQLVEEGFDNFFVRRSLAFSGMDVENARAILMADREDEEAETAAAAQAQAEAEAAAAEREEPAPMKTVTVDYPKDFDPLASAAPKPQQKKEPEGAPPPAKKEDVIFEGTVEDLQRLVIESPVPVLLDVYADWCGPCKQLTPALEQICINAGGMLRLVKINTDQQRQVSGALEVKSLPTVFGMRDGKILNSFEGMPRDEGAVRNFLMGLMVPGQNFNPPVSAEAKKKYDELSGKVVKLAAGAAFSFSARERLQNHVGKLLDELVNEIGGETGMAVADDSARVLRSLLGNIIANPFEEKFRRVKLDNKVIAAKVSKYQPCMSILKSVGFTPDGEAALVVAKGKRVANIAPFVVGRDCIDKWIDKNRYHIAAAGRKRRDEAERARLAREAEEAARNQPEEESEEEEEEEEDDSSCVMKLRLEGKKKVHDVEMDADDTLGDLLERLPFPVEDGEAVQFTCAARRLIVKSTDSGKMSQTLSELRLVPAASIVVKVGGGDKGEVARGSLAERAASSKKKTGSHSMHSIGLYAKDDNNKAETFESGGVLYDHVLTDDEDEGDESEADGGDGEGDEDDEEEGDESEDSVEEDEQ